MRYLISLLFIGLWIGLDAQTTTYPYNPDANGDSAIGAVDLLELLPIFGSYFSPNEIEINGASLEDYLIQLQASIDSLNAQEAVPPSAIDSIYIEEDALIIQLSDGTGESFPLPQPIDEIQYNVTNNYSSLEVPTWMINVKSSPSPENFHGACMSGAISDDDDLHLFYTVVPEAIFKSQFPIYACNTDDNLYGFSSVDIQYSHSSSDDPNCYSYAKLSLLNLDLRGAFVTDASYLYRVVLYNADASFSTWNIPPYSPPAYMNNGSIGSFYIGNIYPLGAQNSNFSYSSWRGVPSNTMPLGRDSNQFYDCDFSHSTFRNVELDDEFFGCNFSHCLFYNVYLDNDWPDQSNDLSDAIFRCMIDDDLNSLPSEYWELSDDNECDEPNRYRFDYVGP